MLMLFFILLITISIILFTRWRHSYWKNKGIPQFSPKLLIGDTKVYTTFGEHLRTVYQELKDKKHKHGGIYFFLRPIYVPVDIEIIKAILMNSADHFLDRRLFVSNREQDPLSANLFNLDAEEWKPLRSKLSPAFTSAKIKMMFDTILDCAKNLNNILDKYSSSKEPAEFKGIFSRFTIDVICSCAFGFECNATKYPNSEFAKYLQSVFQSSFMSRLRIVAAQVLPIQLLTLFNLKLVSNETEQFFLTFVKHILVEREKSKIYRKDFMHLLLQMKNEGNNQCMLNTNEIIAQCFAFFVAGFDSTATALTFALFELSSHQHIQDKVRKDILDVLSRHDYRYTYESVNEMDYLERILKETLRKYPPAAGLDRRSTKSFKIPGSDIVLDKGTYVHIPAYAIHMDSEYYPDPEVFDPERFTKESIAKRPSCTWLPFGEGPRNCIGIRFAMFECKVALANIISRNRVTLSSKTVLPLVMDPGTPITTPKGRIWLNIRKLQ